MSRKERVGIYGGTFNPPHVGHVGAAEAFSRTAGLDKLIIMPDFLPPHKELRGAVTPEDRLEMCRRAFSHLENVEVSDHEIKRGGKSYTAVTLESFSSAERELFFLVGTDMLLTLGTWYHPERIFELATVCYVRRECDPDISRAISERIEEYKRAFNARIMYIPLDVIEVSSSKIRKDAEDGADRDFLPEAVYEYIKDKELYQ